MNVELESTLRFPAESDKTGPTSHLSRKESPDFNAKGAHVGDSSDLVSAPKESEAFQTASRQTES